MEQAQHARDEFLAQDPTALERLVELGRAVKAEETSHDGAISTFTNATSNTPSSTGITSGATPVMGSTFERQP